MSASIVHGGGLDAAIARFGGRREDWLDLSTGINPIAWPLPSLSANAWQALPDKGATADLLDAARNAYRVSAELGIVAANGTQALIELLPRVFSCDRIAIKGPTYQEHELCWTKAGRHADRISASDPLPLLANAAVVVNPNNPDGHVYPREELVALADQLALRHGWLIVDEAFADCDPEASIIPVMGDAGMPENIIVLRSFGKFFGLAGIRLGFAIAPHSVTVQLEHLMGPWAVSGPALEIGRVALADNPWIEATRQQLKARAASLNDVLNRNGFRIEGGTDLFTLASQEAAFTIHEGLCREHILTRQFPEHPNWLRFGLCPGDHELERLERALRLVMP